MRIQLEMNQYNVQKINFVLEIGTELHRMRVDSAFLKPWLWQGHLLYT